MPPLDIKPAHRALLDFVFEREGENYQVLGQYARLIDAAIAEARGSVDRVHVVEEDRADADVADDAEREE